MDITDICARAEVMYQNVRREIVRGLTDPHLVGYVPCIMDLRSRSSLGVAIEWVPVCRLADVKRRLDLERKLLGKVL